MEFVVANTVAPITVVNETVVLNIGGQGMQGVPGAGLPAGGLTGQAITKNSDTNYDFSWNTITNTSVIAVAGGTTSALRLVYTDPATGKIFYADKDTPETVSSLLGVTTQAGSADDEINILTAGVWEDSNWNWNMSGNVNLFLSANGAIVQGAPTAEVIVRIGYAISATKIMVRIGELILTI